MHMFLCNCGWDVLSPSRKWRMVRVYIHQLFSPKCRGEYPNWVSKTTKAVIRGLRLPE